MPRQNPKVHAPRAARHPVHSAFAVSLPRALSKLGYCSRTEALALIEAGRVLVNGRPARSASQRVDMSQAVIVVDGGRIAAQDKIYLMLNKPRGIVTTRRDPQQRGTVYDCLPGGLPFLSPVGRLDKASEGLLLLTNDTQWAERLMNPASGVTKTYHVKIDRTVSESFIAALSEPVEDGGECLSARSVRLLRTSARSSWIEIVLTEGRNRQVRRMMAAQGANVLRLVRVAIGGVSLGGLAKGETRSLSSSEHTGLAR
ncbi:Ribosomal large subunit pseudouridine synthase B [Sphingobium indicum BiD32]|uniref:Pseudouridine synthase n=1 Tax=Sphingobium indicum BiD32 TaxID=1301087 RepID=N1MNT9_9SPHN|nr:pseudouridine synthase [Sphingobium indicum]CCW17267.1 Ribosomal large subunit pseudouridine synthase B [Sphingobium indicum BiD32]